MGVYYDSVLRDFMPAIKGSIARTMAAKYGLKQVEIAKLIGVTQAEISKYVNGEQPKAGRAAFDAKKIDRIVQHMLRHRNRKAQRGVCSLCPKGAALECRLMVR